MSRNLDLYARIEPLIGFYEAYDELYAKYLQILKTLNPYGKKMLDFGCGNGKFATVLQDCGFDIIGIDKSEEMVKKAKISGIKVYNTSIFELEEKFDFIFAISDVLNYFNEEQLKDLFKHIPKLLKPNGYFIFDLNTLYGFSEVANGIIHNEDKGNNLIIDGYFEDDRLNTKIVFFQKEDELYKKEECEIDQYYFSDEFIIENLPLKYIKKDSVKLFSEDDFDKSIFIFQN